MNQLDAMRKALQEGVLTLKFANETELSLWRRQAFRHRKADRRAGAEPGDPIGESIFDNLSFISRGCILRIIRRTQPVVLPEPNVQAPTRALPCTHGTPEGELCDRCYEEDLE